MSSIFSFNNPLNQFLVKILKLLWLNVLWLVSSLPLFTLGASTTALYYTALRLSRDEEGYLTRDFFHAFKKSFKNATVFFFLIVLVFAVCIADFFFLGDSPLVSVRLLAFGVLGFLLCFSFTSVYLLPLTAQFENSIPGTFRTALGITARNLHWSLCLVVLNVVLPLVILFQFLPLVIFGPALPIFLQSLILNSLFRKYLPDGEFQPGSIARIRKPLS